MVSSRKYSNEAVDAFKEIGTLRAQCERELLLMMFEGFSNIQLQQNGCSAAYLMNQLYSLEEYTSLINADTDPGYASLTGDARAFFHVIIALDSLVLNNLVERRILFSNDHAPEDGFVNLNGELDGTEAYLRSWLARSLIVSDVKEKTFKYPDYMCNPENPPVYYTLEYIEYQLTTKGYDVALKIQGHNDEEKRFKQQTELTSRALTVSASSAKTARTALWAAGAIALGSIGNLVFALLKHFSFI